MKPEESIRDLLGMQHTLDCFVKALIKTHPQPEQLKTAFQEAVSERQTQMSDQGFANHWPAEQLSIALLPFLTQANFWLAFFGDTNGPSN